MLNVAARVWKFFRVPIYIKRSFHCSRNKFYVYSCVGVLDHPNSVRLRKNYSTEKRHENKALSSVSHDSDVSTSVKETVKETAKTVSYLSIIIVGLGITSVIFYAIFRELFSSKSPNSVYSKALTKCCNDNRIKDALGEPLKGFGEETRRGRRRHVSHVFYEKGGVQYLRMKFYMQGSRKRGTVHLEMKEDSKGDFQYRYLFLQLDDYTNRVIVLEDNRLEPTSPPLSSKDSFDTSPFDLSSN